MSEKKQYNLNDRYYKVDDGYDKRVYENTLFSWCQIILVLIGFYIFNSLMTWGLFIFGIWKAADFTFFSIAIFIAGVFVLAIMLITGHWANKKAHLSNYLTTKISEKKALKEEALNRKKQDEEYKKRQLEQEAHTADGARNWNYFNSNQLFK